MWSSILLLQLAVACTGQSPKQDASRETTQDTSQNAASVPATDTKLVVAFGDSLYAGYNLEPGQGFVPALTRSLAAAGIKAQVVNAAVSGDTSSAGRQRLTFALDGLPRKPDLVILGLGGNDMLRGISPDVTRSNLEAMLDTLRQRGIPTFLTGMVASPNMGPDYAGAFNAIYPALARKYEIGLYPFFLDGVIGQPKLLLEDGIHPNQAGIQAIVARLSPVIAQQLKP